MDISKQNASNVPSTGNINERSSFAFHVPTLFAKKASLNN